MSVSGKDMVNRMEMNKKYVVRCFYCCRAILATSPKYMQGGLRMLKHFTDGKVCEGRYDLNDGGKQLTHASELLESEKARLSKYLPHA